MTESIYLIYKHTSPSGKSYIGQTKDYMLRCWQHQQPSSMCRAFSAAIKKYGWDNFTHEFLIEYITEDEANTLEVFYIKEHQSLSPGGYNLTEGGGNGTASEETRAKMSAAHKGKKLSAETIAKRSAAVMGAKRSEETKAKISATKKGKPSSRKGIPHSDETKAKIGAASKGRVHTDESKAKISAAHTGKKWSAESIAKRTTTAKGAKRSDETKAKMSVAKKGKSLSLEHKAKQRSGRLDIPYEEALQYFLDKTIFINP
jgi:group I intron endonuclease